MKKPPRQSIISHMLLVFVLFNAVSLLVFTYVVIEKDRRQADANAEASLMEIASEKASLISLSLSVIAQETESLALWAEEYIRTESDMQDLSRQYYTTGQGVLHRRPAANQETARSNVFLPAGTEMTPQQVRMIHATEKLDAHFIRLCSNQEAIQWVYISTEDGLLRCYPYDDLDYKPDHQQKEDHFYVAANEANNPGKMTIWTFPYTDFLGTGWMVSCSHPVYMDGLFTGVVSSDVRIETIQRQFLDDLRLGGAAKVFLLNDAGDIIYHPDYETEAWQKGEVYLKNIFAEGQLSGHEELAVRTALEAETSGLITYRKEPAAKERALAYGKIPDLNWTVAVEIGKSEYWSAHYLNESSLIAFLCITILTLLALAYTLYHRISRPVGQLVEQAERIAEGQYDICQLRDQYKEIHTLSEAFNMMSQRIKDYTDDLIRKNKEVETIFNSIRGLLMILDREGNVILINESGRKLARTRRQENKPSGNMLDRPRKCFQMFCGRLEKCLGCRMEEVFETGEDLYCQLVWEGRIFNNSYFPVRGRDGRVVEIVVYSVDDTERVLLEKQFQQGEKMAGIGQISTAIAHELKNPLAVIKGSAYLLKSYGCDGGEEEKKEMVDTIWDSVKEAEQVIYSLLDFSGREEGGPVQVDVTKIVSQLLLLSNHDCIKQGITVRTSFRPSPLLYQGNKEAMKSVLQNIVTNAIHALEQGGLLEIEGWYQMEADREWLKLSVRDTGPGISKNALEKIYQPFFTAGQRQGTGLGLWITKRLIDKMEGNITVESQVGRGTRFLLSFPVRTKIGSSGVKGGGSDGKQDPNSAD